MKLFVTKQCYNNNVHVCEKETKFTDTKCSNQENLILLIKHPISSEAKLLK